MKKSLYLIFFVVQLSYAQNAKIDSLKAVLTLSQGVERIDVLLELATVLVDIDNQRSLEFGMESFRMASNSGDSMRIVNAGIISAKALRRLERYDSAIILGSYCEQIAYRNKFSSYVQGTILNGVGVAYLFVSKYDQALSYFQKALTFYEQSGDKKSISISLNNIGLTFLKLQDHKLALKYYGKSLEVKNSIGSTYDLDLLMVNISIAYLYLNNLKEARRTLQPIIEKCSLECSDFIFVESYLISGLIWLRSDSLQRAEKDFLKSYAAAEATSNNRLLIDNIVQLSQIYSKRGDLFKAEKILLQGQKLAKNTPLNSERIKIYNELSVLYKVKCDIEKLSAYQTKYIQLNDSIYNESQTNNLMQLHAEAIEKEYREVLVSQEKMMELKNAIINKQLGINLLIGLTLMLLAVLVYVLTRKFDDRKLANILLSKKIDERIAEIERNRFDLLSAIEHQDSVLTQWKNTLNISVESMHELCSIAMSNELNAEGHKYFTEIEGITRKVSKSLDSVLLESKLAVPN